MASNCHIGGCINRAMGMNTLSESTLRPRFEVLGFTGKSAPFWLGPSS